MRICNQYEVQPRVAQTVRTTAWVARWASPQQAARAPFSPPKISGDLGQRHLVREGREVPREAAEQAGGRQQPGPGGHRHHGHPVQLGGLGTETRPGRPGSGPPPRRRPPAVACPPARLPAPPRCPDRPALPQEGVDQTHENHMAEFEEVYQKKVDYCEFMWYILYMYDYEIA